MAKKRIRHPVQPVEWDGEGVLRFKSNPIVRHLLDVVAPKVGVDLRTLHMDSETHGFTSHDWDQFNQLIGYSVSGCPIRSRVTRSIADDKVYVYLKKYPTDDGEG